jgi:hypothetical protein
MEASGGIPAAESGQEQVQTGNEPQAPERDSGFSQLTEKFDGFVSGFEERMAQLESRLAQPEEEPEPEEEPFNPDELFQEDGSITPQDLQQWIEQQAELKAKEFVSPLQEQMQRAQAQAEQERLERGADMLEEKYPELADDEWGDRLVSSAQQRAQALAQRLGLDPGVADLLWRQTEFLEDTYLSIKARERAENEVPAGSENGLTLERGNSLGPSGAGDSDEDIVKRIVSARG